MEVWGGGYIAQKRNFTFYLISFYTVWITWHMYLINRGESFRFNKKLRNFSWLIVRNLITFPSFRITSSQLSSQLLSMHQGKCHWSKVAFSSYSIQYLFVQLIIFSIPSVKPFNHLCLWDYFYFFKKDLSNSCRIYLLCGHCNGRCTQRQVLNVLATWSRRGRGMRTEGPRNRNK